MLRYLFALALVAVPLKAQSVTPADTAAIITAARTLAPKADSTGAKPTIELRADTASVTLWVSRSHGQRVRVERRAGQWVGVRTDTTSVLLIRSAPSR